MKIDFEFKTQYGIFRDSLTLDENHGLTDEQIKQLQEARRDAWIAFVENPPVAEDQ
jgi:hypothetical protein